MSGYVQRVLDSGNRALSLSLWKRDSQWGDNRPLHSGQGILQSIRRTLHLLQDACVATVGLLEMDMLLVLAWSRRWSDTTLSVFRTEQCISHPETENQTERVSNAPISLSRAVHLFNESSGEKDICRHARNASASVFARQFFHRKHPSMLSSPL